MSQYFIDVINNYIYHRTKSLVIFIDVFKAKFKQFTKKSKKTVLIIKFIYSDN